MGRYDDRLTVGAGSNKTCANLYLGTASGNIDLGSNTSYNKQEMYIGTASGNKRVTRVREDYTIYGDKYIYGPLTQTSATQHFCNCAVISEAAAFNMPQERPQPQMTPALALLPRP